MQTYFRGPLFNTWLLLVAATVLSAALGLEGERAGSKLALLVLLIALAKCRLVIRNYMEVREGPPWLRRSCDGWLLLNAVMLSSHYWA